MAVELGNATLFALVVLIINGGLQWIRELRKGTFWNTNGKDLKAIKDSITGVDGKITCLDGKVGTTTVKIAEVKVAVDAQQAQCKTTVERFDKTIGDQNRELISLAKRRK